MPTSADGTTSTCINTGVGALYPLTNRRLSLLDGSNVTLVGSLIFARDHLGETGVPCTSEHRNRQQANHAPAVQRPAKCLGAPASRMAT